jgi:uncharacterized protein YbcI
MRECLTTAEKTMLEFGHPNQVRAFRQLFQNEMTERLTGMVEDLTGRKVVNYQSQVLFDPDMSLEIFVFDSEAEHPPATVAVIDQADEVEDAGAATHEAPLEPPSRAGESRG